MSTDGGGDGGGMTLAFSLSALDRLEDPAAVFEDARTWSRFVGVVDDDLEAVERTVSDYGLGQDFDLGDRDRWLAMEGIRESTRTPRHVYVGTTGADRQVAIQLGWEYLHVTEAAERADWTLSGEGSGGGIVGRVLRAVPDRLLPFRPR
jgi:hypothetical protein